MTADKLSRSSDSFRQLVESLRWAFAEVWTKHAALVVGLALCTLARGLVPAALALVIRGLLNAVVDMANRQADAFTLILPWLACGAGLTVMELLSSLSYRYLAQRFADDIDITVTAKILRHANELDVGSFEDSRFQDVIHRAQDNTANRLSRFFENTLTFGVEFVQIVSLVAVLVAIEPLVAAVMVPFALVHLWFQWGLAKKHYLDEFRRATKRRWSSYFVSLLTTLKPVQEVKLLGLGPILMEKCHALLTEFRDENRTRYLSSFSGSSAVGILTAIAFYCLFGRVLLRYTAGASTIGDVAVFGTVGFRLRTALESAVLSITGALGQALYICNLREFLRVQPRTRAVSGLVPHSSRGEIEFCNVSFTYPGATKPVLSDVSFQIKRGETVALVGKNGAGKTTLAKLLARFYDPDAGSIYYDGIDLRQLSPDYIYRQIAFVVQGSIPYEATALENIAYGDWSRLARNRDEIERIARYAGADKMIESMPLGYDTLLGRRFGDYDLSTGQWQQIAMVRAFARNAPLLILDEPTSNLDAVAEYEWFGRFCKLAEGRTTILISHRFSTVKIANRILVLDKGQIVESGTHCELMAREGPYAALYLAQQKQRDSFPRL